LTRTVTLPRSTSIPLASAQITTQSAGRVLASGSAELVGADGGEEAGCFIRFDQPGGLGPESLRYEAQADDSGTDNPFVIAVNFATTLPAGTHTAGLFCRRDDPAIATVNSEDAAISLIGVGS